MEKQYRRKTEKQARELIEKIRRGGGWAEYSAKYSQDGHNTILYCNIEVTSPPTRKVIFETDPETSNTIEAA